MCVLLLHTHDAVEVGGWKSTVSQKERDFRRMGQAKSRIRIETAFDLSYLQNRDRNVDLKQISQRRGVSKTKWSRSSVPDSVFTHL